MRFGFFGLEIINIYNTNAKNKKIKNENIILLSIFFVYKSALLNFPAEILKPKNLNKRL